MAIVAVAASDKYDVVEMKYLLESATRGGFNVDIVGIGKKFSWLARLQWYREYLEGLPTDTNQIVCFTDAYDVFYTSDLATVEQKFLEFDADIVWSAEKWYSCQLSSDKEFYDSLCTNGYRYLNAGTFMGYKSALLALFTDLMDGSLKDPSFVNDFAKETPSSDGIGGADQMWISHHIRKNFDRYKIRFDNHCKIFYIPCGDWDAIDSYVSETMVIKSTGNRPCIIHVPWKARYEHILKNLFERTFPIVSTKQNLVYFSVFYNSDYFRLANLLLNSICLFSSTDTFDVLILTQPEFREKAEELSKIVPLKIYCLPLTTIFQAACARLHIFNYAGIDQYEKILYLDTDIIIKKDLAPLFELPLEDKLYALESGTINLCSFGSQFFDLAVFDGETAGINSGTLLFNNCSAVRGLFERIKIHTEEFTGHPPSCMDQPFINYHAIKDDLREGGSLKPYVTLYENHDNSDNYETSIVCHFSYPIGNSGHKYNRMAEFFKRILEEKSEDRVVDISGKTYTWGPVGTIHFGAANYLGTTWGHGVYEVLRNNRVRAIWNNHVHILTFTDAVSTYTSVRIHPPDFDVVVGGQKS